MSLGVFVVSCVPAESSVSGGRVAEGQVLVAEGQVLVAEGSSLLPFRFGLRL